MSSPYLSFAITMLLSNSAEQDRPGVAKPGSSHSRAPPQPLHLFTAEAHIGFSSGSLVVKQHFTQPDASQHVPHHRPQIPGLQGHLCALKHPQVSSGHLKASVP